MILVGGENLIDLVPIEGGAPYSFQALPGGAPFNCAMALGRQGQKVGYLTPVSSDNLGNLLTTTLTDSGVEVLSKRRDEPTSLAVVALQDGAASYQFYRNGTAERMVTLEGLIKRTPTDAKALHLGSLALADGADADVWAQYFCQIHQQGIFTTLDPNIRAAFIRDRAAYMARLDMVLGHTDLLKLSDEDLNWLYPDQGTQAAAAKLAKQSLAKILIVTLGGDGAFALVNGRAIHIEATPVSDLRDTIGAGDTFMATLLACLSRADALTADAIHKMDGKSIRELLQWAAQAAALSCARSGCNPPDFPALEASYKAR